MIITPEIKKMNVEMNQDWLDKLEQSIVQSINSLKNEMINQKKIIKTGRMKMLG